MGYIITFITALAIGQSQYSYPIDYYSLSEDEYRRISFEVRYPLLDDPDYEQLSSCEIGKRTIEHNLNKHPLHPFSLYYPDSLVGQAKCFENPELDELRHNPAEYKKYYNLRYEDFISRAKRIEQRIDFSVEDERQSTDKIFLAYLYYICGKDKYYVEGDYLENEVDIGRYERCTERSYEIAEKLKTSSLPAEFVHGNYFYCATLDHGGYLRNKKICEEGRETIINKLPDTMIAAVMQMMSTYPNKKCFHGKLADSDWQECAEIIDREALKSYKYDNFYIPPLKGGTPDHYYSFVESNRTGLFLSQSGSGSRFLLPGARDPRNTLLGITGTIERQPHLTGDETLEEILKLNETPPPGYKLEELIRDRELAKRAFAEAGWVYHPPETPRADYQDILKREDKRFKANQEFWRKYWKERKRKNKTAKPVEQPTNQTWCWCPW